MVVRTIESVNRPPLPYRTDAPRADVPVPGFYRRKLVKNGPWVAVRIWLGAPRDPVTGELMDRSPRFQAVRAGLEVDIWQVWPDCCGEPISEDEYHRLLAQGPVDPLMPVNLASMAPVF